MANIFGFFNTKEPASNKPLQDRVLVISKHRCPENHPCPSIRVCPVGALTQKGYAAPVVDQSKCTKCGRCVKYCPMRAIALE